VTTWEENVIDLIYLKEIEREYDDKTHLFEDRDQWWTLVNRVKNFQAP
jgi:hypothetical protein